MNKEYVFKSERLGFRLWLDDDLEDFTELNSDSEVMEHFPKSLTKSETEEFIQRLQKHYLDQGYNYYATELLETGEFIGFIGLAYQEFESEFNPSTDIGWRLKRSSWGKGYATEGAKRCLDHAFNTLKLESIISTCVVGNSNSEKVMRKIGMTKKGTFDHPKLKEYPTFEKCVWYEIKREQWEH